MKFVAGIAGTLLFAALLAPYGGIAADLAGRVVGVHDGDTITVLDASNAQPQSRLAGIDALKLKQAFGTRSKENLSKWIYNRLVCDARQ